jgi:hypothetical protein
LKKLLRGDRKDKRRERVPSESEQIGSPSDG